MADISIPRLKELLAMGTWPALESLNYLRSIAEKVIEQDKRIAELEEALRHQANRNHWFSAGCSQCMIAAELLKGKV